MDQINIDIISEIYSYIDDPTLGRVCKNTYHAVNYIIKRKTIKIISHSIFHKDYDKLKWLCDNNFKHMDKILLNTIKDCSLNNDDYTRLLLLYIEEKIFKDISRVVSCYNGEHLSCPV